VLSKESLAHSAKVGSTLPEKLNANDAVVGFNVVAADRETKACFKHTTSVDMTAAEACAYSVRIAREIDQLWDTRFRHALTPQEGLCRRGDRLA
jgi:hypothetical protein